MVKQSKAKYIIIAGICLMSCLLTGCATIFSNPKGQDEVEERLAEVSPNESFTFKEVERRDGLPKHDTYYYESDERDFTIKVYSAVAQDDLQGMKLPFYYKYIYINYPGVVKQLYFDDAVNIIEASELYSPNAHEWTKEDLEHASFDIEKQFVVTDVEDFDEVVSIISKVNEIYSEEIQYNGEEWTSENPLFIIDVLWYDENAEEHQYTSLGNFKIDGTASYDEIDEQLRSAYKEKIEEGINNVLEQ